MRYVYLDKISSPADFRQIPRRELPRLAAEIRRYISEVVHHTGGHLASNLGVVELTVALHYVFDFLEDRLLWDVSHQAYAHKILTGRRRQFEELRQQGGLSGFANPAESEYDPFITGHSGTSISTALGIAAGDAASGRDRNVVAVIGDGSLGAGMAFEALNNASHIAKRLIVILNDNEMSISPTVGALSTYFNRLRFSPIYTDLKKDIHAALRSVPLVGPQMDHALDRALGALRSSVMPGHFFEELGFRYYGPFDGHNVELLVEVLGKARKAEELELIHVVTKKGKGFDEAEQNPTQYHSASNFLPASAGKVVPSARAGKTGGHDSESCPPRRTAGLPGAFRKTVVSADAIRSPKEKEKRPSYTAVFSSALVKLAREYPRVVAITAAMPDGTGLSEFQKVFPGRYFDVGICEQHALGLAAGLSKSGYFPVFAVYSTFLQRGYDQLFHEIALNNTPCLVCIDRGGLVGADGPTHHGVFDIAYMRHLPGLVLAAPATCADLYPLMKLAVEEKICLAVRYPRDSCPEEKIAFSGEGIELGKGKVLRKGTGVALLPYGSEVQAALEAADILASDGIKVTVADPRFAKPLDGKLITSLVRKHKHLVTIEDHILAGGFGSAVLEFISEQGLDSRKLRRLGIPDRFIEHAPRGAQLASLGLDAAGIARTVRSLL
jgi:1-deoxy-D-xylulose-5-phosphate synthase